MYKLLIVDDEIYTLEALREVVDWQCLGITEVFTAFNINCAKEIIEEQHIDIVLSDIEMPQGSGLDLLEWLKEHQPQIAAIMLSCHADFSYAQKTIKAGGLGYLLKPVRVKELTEEVQKAIEKLKRQKDYQEGQDTRRFWNMHHSILVEKFWLDIIDQKVPSNPQAFRDLAARMNIEYSDDMRIMPILMWVQHWDRTLNTREIKIMNFALKNSAEELVANKNHRVGRIIEVDSGFLVGIIVDTESSFSSDLEADVTNYIEACNRYFNCSLSCYIGQQVYPYQLVGMIERLTSLHENNVSLMNKVFSLDRWTSPSLKINMPDMNMWFHLLREGSRESMLKEAIAYLENLINKEGVDSSFIRQFHQDFLQMLYLYLKEKGIQAHQLFSDPTSLGLSYKSTRSVIDLLGWVKYSVFKATDYVNDIEHTNTVVKKVKQYIALNLDQDLSREKIAEHVCLNKDYLSRFFKKETGFALYDYISQERVKVAKELLSKTNTSIGAIASSVGYCNFSHFSQMFKRYTGASPGDYREKCSV